MKELCNNKLISIIIPVYNVEKYIKKCIDSVIEQTYKNIEIILIDDGSTDSSGYICDEYAKFNSNIKVIHQKNCGLSEARNRGLDIAIGDYIFFLDSDDYIAYNTLEIMLNKLEKTQSDICVCGTQRVDIYNCKTDMIFSLEKKQMSGKEALEHIYDKNGWLLVISWNKLYKREIWNDLRFDKGKIHEDEFIIHKIYLKCEKVITIPENLYFYRINPYSITESKISVKRLDGVEAIMKRGLDCYTKMSSKWIYETIHNIYYIIYEISLYEDKNLDIKSRLIEVKKQCYNFFKLMKKYAPKYKTKINKIYFKIKYRKFYSKLLKIKQNLIKLKNIYKSINKLKNSDIILMDTPTHGNSGDLAIVEAELEFFKTNFPNKKIYELTAYDIDRLEYLYSKITPKNKLILIPGGGFMGYLWPNEEYRIQRIIKNFKNHNIVILPQTVTFNLKSNDGRKFFNRAHKIYKSHKKLSIFVRDKKSFLFMQNNMPEVKVELVPDSVTIKETKNYNKVRKNILICMRKDIEKNISEEDYVKILETLKKYNLYDDIYINDTILPYNVSPIERKLEVDKKLEQFASAKLVITDRLHGMIFSAITNTPCIAFGNINGKVKGVYEWISNNDFIYYLDNVSQIENIIKNMDFDNEYYYDNEFIYEKFEPLIDTLKEILN